jgi:predicted RNA-binding protein with RPS1 domain
MSENTDPTSEESTAPLETIQARTEPQRTEIEPAEISTAEISTSGASAALEPSPTATQTGENPAPESAGLENTSTENNTAGAKSAAGGPISLDRIRQLRMSQQQTRDPSRGSKPKSAAPNFKAAAGGPSAKLPTGEKPAQSPAAQSPASQGDLVSLPTPPPLGTASKVAVPSRRQPLSKDMEDELAAYLGDANLDSMLVGDSSLKVGIMLEEGQRMQAKVMKAHGEFVFVSLGGANEGVLPSLQFEVLPEIGSQLDVIVRGYLPQEGLYELTMPGNAITVDDWSDLKEGDVVEALVTAANTGGLECTVGNIRGFIPASQAAEFRIEDLSEFVDQKVLCVITEANERRGNLVLSRRAVLEREKTEKRAERLAALEIGAAVEGIVRKIMDFGAFVDIGGIDGLLHISQLSWDRVKHPSEVLQEGQKVQVRVDKIDPQSGKIGLSYRSLQEHPWTDIETRFPVGSLIKGTVTRIAEFGAFVRVATGVEGLVHVSELAHYRVQNVGSVVSEGKEVEAKVLSVDTEQQRMSLSLKAAQAAPEKPADAGAAAETVEEPRAEPVLPKHRGPLKGGTARPSGGDQFGLKW